MRKITSLLLLTFLLFNLSSCFILESYFIEDDECTEYRILFTNAFLNTECAWSTTNCGTGANMTSNRMYRELEELREKNPEIHYWTECVDYTAGNEPEPIDPYGF